MTRLVKFLLKFKKFRNALVAEAFKIVQPPEEIDSKIEYAFSDSKGLKYFRWRRPDWMPIQVYEQMQIRLLEIESRMSRETLLLFAENLKKMAEAKDFINVARLAGELEERLNLLYDPQLLMRFLSGIYIREDQLKAPHLWNVRIEEEKFQQLMADNENGSLSFFFQNSDLMTHVRFSGLSSSDSQKLMSEPVIQSQLKEVRLFDQLLLAVSQSISVGKS